MPEETQITEQQPTLATEVSQLLNELKSNNKNGNEIIAILKAENEELKEALLSVRDELLEMLTRADSEPTIAEA